MEYISHSFNDNNHNHTNNNTNNTLKYCRLNDDGSYTYGYEASDGTFKLETRFADGTVQGKYGYIDANGEVMLHVTCYMLHVTWVVTCQHLTIVL